MTTNEIVEFCITWVPTILFIIIVLWAAFVGLIRGFRKSLILLINAAISAIILIVTYVVVVNSNSIDTNIVEQANRLLPSLGLETIQEMLDVSYECTSLTDILMELVPKSMNLGEGMSLVMAENGAYLGAIVNSVYHIIFALVFALIYPLVVFIFYIVYLIAFREGRYKRRKKKAHEEDPDNNPPYKKRRLFGSLVGMGRGMITATVWLSFLGSILFIVAGDNGKNNDVDVNFGNAEIDEYYDIYESIASYGDKGIYAVLNVLHDKNDVPYYLFIADMVLSGSYEDVENRVNAEIVYRKELAAYTRFARETIELLYKYGPEYMDDFVIGDDVTDANMIVMLQDIFSKDGFQEDFEVLINNFESDTFIINFALSFVDSFARHIDEQEMFEDMTPDTVELLRILLTGEDAITVSNIISKEDAKILLNTVIKIIADGSLASDSEDSMAPIKLVSQLLPNLTELSMFKDEAKRQKGNRVLSNVYAYLVANIDNESDSVAAVSKKLSSLTSISTDNIDWMGEIEMLIDRVPDVLTIYTNTFNEETGEVDILHMLDASNPNATENENALDRIINDLCDSDLLGAVLSMSFVDDAIAEAMASLGEGIVIPSNLHYTRQYDAYGNVVSDGELYSVLSSLKIMLKNGLGDIVDSMENEDADQTQMIKDIIDILLIEEDGVCAIDKLIESKLLTYTLSHMLLTIDLGDGLTIIVPDSSLEITNDVDKDGNPYKILRKSELKSIVTSISTVLPQDGEEMFDIKNIILSKDEILSSDILHATIISFLVESLAEYDDLITIPVELKNAASKEALKTNFSNNLWYTSKEISKVLSGIDLLLGISSSDEPFDFSTIDADKIMDNVFTLTEDADGDTSTLETKLDICYSSTIMKQTLSNQIDNALSNDLIDENVKNSAKLDNYYKASEIASLIDAVNVLDIDFANIDESMITNTITKLNDDANPNDDIDITNLDICFKSTIFKGIVTKQVDAVLTADLVNTALRDSTKINNLYTSSEIGSLLNGIEILGIDFNNIEIDNIQDIVLSLNEDADPTDSLNETKLDVCYKSVLFQGIVSLQLDNVLYDSIISVKNKDLIKTEYLSTGAKIFLKEDINDAVNAINTLGIEDIQNISLDSVKIKKSSIALIASSKIIRAILDKNLSDYASSASGTDSLFVLPNRARDYANLEYTFLSEQEVNNLLSVLWDELGTDAGDDYKNISMEVDLSSLSINSSNINNFTSSYIILSTISDKLSSYLYIPEDAFDSSHDAHITDIKKEELTKLIVAIEQFQPNGISINVDFNTDNLKLTRAKISTALESTIMHYAISSQIVENINDIPNEAYVESSLYSYNGITRSLVSKTEINNLIKALQDILLGSSLSDPEIDITNININGSDINVTKSKINSIMDINRSYIVHNMVTQTITDSLEVVPKVSYIDSECKYIKASEVNAIIDLIGTGSGDNRGISVGGTSSLSFGDINIDSTLIANSSILRYKISEELLKITDATILIPEGIKDVVEVVGSTNKSWILESEIKTFLDGIATITGGSLDTSNMDISFPSDINNVAKSAILRATITSKLQFNIGGSSVNIVADLDDKDELATPSMPIINEDEMVKLLNAVKVIFASPSFEASLNLDAIAGLSKENIYTITSSSVMKNILTINITASGFENIEAPVVAVDIYNGADIVSYELSTESALIPGWGKLPNGVVSTAGHSVYSITNGSNEIVNVYVEQSVLQAFFSMLFEINNSI